MSPRRARSSTARCATAAPGSIRSRSRALLAAYAHPDRAGRAGARSPTKRSPRPAPLLAEGGAVVAQDPVARHRAQVRCRRRAAQPHQRSAPCATPPPTFWRARARPGRTRASPASPIHPMIVRPKARELIAGIADDPTFGPVIVFGRGGTAVEVIDDKALALPPLDLKLARDLIARTRVSRVLKAYRNVPAADETRDRAGAGQARAAGRRPAGDARARSQSAARRRERRDRASMRGWRSRRSRSARRGPAGHPRFAIRPYPKEWERHVALRDGTAMLRASGAAGGRAALRAVLRRGHASRTCGCASSRRSRNSATPSSRASPRSTTRAPWPSSRSTRRPARCSASCACTPNANYDTRRIRHPGALRPARDAGSAGC